MKENKLIASVVVFKELLDNNKDIYDIIAEFLKAGIIDQQKWNFTSTELKKLIENVFDFKLPEAVIKSALKNRLIKSNFLTIKDGIYSVKNIKENIDPEFEKNYAEKKSIYKKTEDEFINYIEEQLDKKFTEEQKEKVRENINHYLLGNGINEPYTREISEYIIHKKNDKEFANRLNTVKEGVVLYTGVRYTADLNELGKWSKPLTIFLDTEVLFNYLGFNGEVYKNIFLDFIKLVREINLSNPKRKLINLKYFSETESEIHNFFHVATLIIENKMSLDPSKTAMKEIVNGCQSKSDIIVKKNKFFIDLQTSGILLEEDKDYYSNHSFNIEGNDVVTKLAELSKNNGRHFDEEYCKNNLKLFTKINVLRKGISDNGFENCNYILLTGNRYLHYLAHNPEIKLNEKDIPFATDIDFITDKFWFKLKKGFGTSDDIPRSFDMITKAQMVLSSQINNTVQEKFTVLNEKYNSGEITKQEAISLTYTLRENSLKPEEITDVSIADSLVFINDFTIENHLRERELLNQKVEEGEEAKNKLKRIELKERTKKNKKFKLFAKSLKIISILLFFASIVLIYYLGYIGIRYFKTESDSALSLISFVIGLIVLFPFWKYFRKFNNCIDKRIIEWFKLKITSA
jgi:hypothetical protein